MSERTARHRRPDHRTGTVRTDPEARLLAVLGAPATSGWVPQRPEPPSGQPPPTSRRTRPDSGSPAQDPVGVLRGERLRASLPALRVHPAGRAVLGLAAFLLLAVLVALILYWRGRPESVPAPRLVRTVSSVPAASPSGAPAASMPPSVTVHVVGAVHRPGLAQLPAGARVADAIRAAGGTTTGARLASVNLARPLVDGEQLVVQRRDGPTIVGAPGGFSSGAGSAGAATGPGTAASPVDLNTASLEALDGLPGIGPVLAQRILDWRGAHGRFSAVDELGEVAGIGEATLADLRPLVAV